MDLFMHYSAQQYSEERGVHGLRHAVMMETENTVKEIQDRKRHEAFSSSIKNY
jgi:hypothetical protein